MTTEMIIQPRDPMLRGEPFTVCYRVSGQPSMIDAINSLPECASLGHFYVDYQGTKHKNIVCVAQDTIPSPWRDGWFIDVHYDITIEL